MGKTVSGFREVFSKQPIVGEHAGRKKDRFKCKYCSWLTADNASRMKEHVLSKCKKIPEDVKRCSNITANANDSDINSNASIIYSSSECESEGEIINIVWDSENSAGDEEEEI